MLNSNEKAAIIRSGLHDSIHMIHREDWTHVARGASPYLQYDHLRALEDSMSDEMEFRYVIFYCEENRPMGIAYFQVVDLLDQGSQYRDAVARLGKGLGGRIIEEMRVRCLVNGNVFHCGDHGSYFLPEVPEDYRLLAITDTLRKLDKGDHAKTKASVLIVKEHWPERFTSADRLADKHFHPLTMDVNMVMELDEAWVDLDSYQAALSSKARTRIRSVLKRSDALEVRDLSAKEIKTLAPRLQALFAQVLERSPFLFGRLSVPVYAEWKKQLHDKLIFRGFFLHGELVGFSSAFVLNGTMDVQYIGLDYPLNQTHSIYQRMLVDLLELALEKGLRRINFGRTAEQTKSNLGAVPVEMRFYVKHRNRLANKLVGPFLRAISPDEFEQRSPFKANIK